jgi:geranylgeranyl diphosphate synthase, type I
MATPLGERSGRKKSSESQNQSAAQQVESAVAPYREQISEALRRQLPQHRPSLDSADARTSALLDVFYGQMEYHFGWRDASLAPAIADPGKLLRPALVLLSAQLFARLQGEDRGAEETARAMPAAIAIEMVHNFSLIHDDIEDGDEVRRHRATLWRVWGQAQAINTGDGLFTLARTAVLDLVDRGVTPETVLRLAALLDRTCLRLCEGQHLDMSFEGKRDVTPEMYLAMIERKTAALMECATEMGARIGGADEDQAHLMGEFGRALGIGFQLRDDLLGIWATDELLGKHAAGDLRRKKMSLPVIYAMREATRADRQTLDDLYAQDGALDDEHVERALGILDRVQARQHVRGILVARCRAAREALARARASAPGARSAHGGLAAMVDFVEADVL